MAPSRQSAPPFTKDERVLCFHHEMLYEAKVLEVAKAPIGPGNVDGWKFKIHYKGWKNTWDDWVTSDRMRKFTDENKELATQLLAQAKTLSKGSSATTAVSSAPAKGVIKKGRADSAARGSEERTTGVAHSSGRGPRRARDYELEQEDAFHARPAIQLPIADHVKALLVDDWENITKNCMLVPLPHPHPVSEILNDYLETEKKLRQVNSASWDILHEVVAGIREYFEKALGKILLYKFERPQYHDMVKLWESGKESYTGPVDTYGAEHLARLLVSLPELVAQTNMDQQSVARLREELSKFSIWLAKHATSYFVTTYESPDQEYLDEAKLGHM